MSRQSAAAYLNVYSVREFEASTGQKGSSWIKVGVAVPHKEPPGFNVELNALPLDGHLVVLPPPADEAPA